MGNMETLFHATAILPQDAQLFMMSSTSMTWLLPSGSHKIDCNPKSSLDQDLKVRYCSLIPIGSPCTVTTSGLKWDLNNDTLAFGRLVSTSNEIHEANETKQVTVANSVPIVFSMEFE
jgi:thiamine pyrophosphokinase